MQQQMRMSSFRDSNRNMNQDPKMLTKSTLANVESGEKRTQLPALTATDQNGYVSDFYKNKAARESDKN